jgi:hypothetical protein
VTEGKKRERCRLVQSRAPAWVVLIFYLFLLGTMVAPETVDAAGSDVRPWAAVVFLPLILLLVWVSWRMFRIGVRVCANEAKIVNMFKTIAVPWTEIDRFEVSTSGPIIGIAHLRSGERILLWGLAGPPNPATRIEELNAELRQRTAGPGDTPERPHATRGAAG